jgi:hypothetical protein
VPRRWASRGGRSDGWTAMRRPALPGPRSRDRGATSGALIRGSAVLGARAGAEVLPQTTADQWRALDVSRAHSRTECARDLKTTRSQTSARMRTVRNTRHVGSSPRASRANRVRWTRATTSSLRRPTLPLGARRAGVSADAHRTPAQDDKQASRAMPLSLPQFAQSSSRARTWGQCALSAATRRTRSSGRPVNGWFASSPERGADPEYHEDEPDGPECTARPTHSVRQFLPCPCGESRVERRARVRVY